MEYVSLYDLKKYLSKWISAALSGETIVVTRYNKPVVFLNAYSEPALHTGKLVGKQQFDRAATLTNKGAALKFLEEDRSDN